MDKKQILKAVQYFKERVMKENIKLPNWVRIVEVGPRDGLQNESKILEPSFKTDMINKLIETGISHIECGSFVSPKWVPQMANSKEVINGIVLPSDKKDNIVISALVPNEKGLEAALQSKINEIAVFTAASETFVKKNINCTIKESLNKFEPVILKATENGLRVRGYVSCVMGCPYEGDIDPAIVNDVTNELLKMGCYEVSLGDTIGIGTPDKAKKLFDALSAPTDKLAMHFHDTYLNAIENILVGLERGVGVIDSAVGGLGGCPYAKKKVGNVCTENIVDLCNNLGIQTGINIELLKQYSKEITKELDREVEYLFE